MPDSNIFKFETGRERRQWERFDLDECQVSVTRKGFAALIDGRSNIARRVLDLSEGGAQLTVSRHLDPGAKVRVTVMLDKFQDGFDTEGTVRWVKRGANAGELRIGIEFTGLDETTRRKINHMKGLFTSPQYQARRQERMKKNPIAFL